MEKDNILQLGLHLTDIIHKKKFIPLELIKRISTILDGDTKSNYKLLVATWTNYQSKLTDGEKLDISAPLLLTRGINGGGEAEDQLINYLPEEKILINKENTSSSLNLKLGRFVVKV